MESCCIELGLDLLVAFLKIRLIALKHSLAIYWPWITGTPGGICREVCLTCIFLMYLSGNFSKCNELKLLCLHIYISYMWGLVLHTSLNKVIVAWSSKRDTGTVHSVKEEISDDTEQQSLRIKWGGTWTRSTSVLKWIVHSGSWVKLLSAYNWSIC